MSLPPSAPGPAAPSARVLGELLAIPALLLGIPSSRGVAELVAQALGYVPGVVASCVCVGDVCTQAGEVARLADCAAAPVSGGAPTRRFELRSATAPIGDIVCAIADEAAFAPYAPFVANFAAFVALALETRAHRLALEHVVAARTRELRESEERFRVLLQRSPVPMWEEDLTDLLDVLGALADAGIDVAEHLRAHPDAVALCLSSLRVVDVNDAVLRLHGASSKEQLLPSLRPIFRPESLDDFTELLIGLAQGRTELTIDARLQTVDGAPLTVTLSLSLLPGPARDRRRALVSTVDISDRMLAQEALRKLSRAVEQSPASIVITNTAGEIEYVNPKFTQITGYSRDELIGKNPRLLKSGETSQAEYQRLWDTIASGGEWRGELHNRRKDGSLYWEMASISPIVDGSGAISHYLAIKEDVTERKRLEEELRASQKMEAVGQLAGGVAHDFNNLLTVIRANASLALSTEGISADLRAAIEEIGDASERAARLTRQLLTFSRRQAVKMRDLDLHELLAGTTKMLQRLIGEHIRLTTRYAPGEARVHADPGMLEQVLMNLAVNARDAMPRGGDLRIETALVQIPEGATRGGARRAGGGFVVVSVADDGCGIEKELLPRIFEPFFTTKEIGRGTGLGLATVFGIVEQHHGFTEVESAVGVGTTFRVYLPRAAQPARASSDAPASGSPRGSETILLVEDESALRFVAGRILRGHGYRVIEAGSGPEALARWDAHKGEIDLVLTDVVMPGGMSGRDLGRRLQLQRPSLPVLYTSGYTDEMLGEGADLREGASFLEKPWVPARLLTAIRANLDAPR